jgi:mersacidin/lichenicidin family type 2 lantibiotic
MPDTVDPKAREIVTRAWKDEKYRNSLPTEVREKLPPPPEGASEMSDEELEAAAGGITPGFVVAGVAAGSVVAGYGVSEIVD